MLLRFIADDGRVVSKRIWALDIFSVVSLQELSLNRLNRFLVSTDSILLLEGEGGSQIAIERMDEQRRLFVFGAGHVGRSVALMGAMLGLKVVLVDDREEFLERSELPDCGIEPLLVDFRELQNSVKLTRQSASVIVTRGHQFDELILKQIADQDTGYVGMIGSRRRVIGIFERLRQQGIDEQFLSKVKAPIGLSIGAISPQEIAVAIHAEIIKYFSLDSGCES